MDTYKQSQPEWENACRFSNIFFKEAYICDYAV